MTSLPAYSIAAFFFLSPLPSLRFQSGLRVAHVNDVAEEMCGPCTLLDVEVKNGTAPHFKCSSKPPREFKVPRKTQANQIVANFQVDVLIAAALPFTFCFGRVNQSDGAAVTSNHPAHRGHKLCRRHTSKATVVRWDLQANVYKKPCTHQQRRERGNSGESAYCPENKTRRCRARGRPASAQRGRASSISRTRVPQRPPGAFAPPVTQAARISERLRRATQSRPRRRDTAHEIGEWMADVTCLWRHVIFPHRK
ncbi:Protein of unknown function, partial [Gryllus bimaculatus]